ncbi:MAG: hypothetical protein KatS3mg019_0044 [Fimbriimonadales bacterium]|nr:MAG: hypothetical protein KatS3mg019_0044 [Fimbriimonadales bacterium]
MSVQPTYPSDPTPQQWAIIEPVLKRALYGRKRKPIGAPRRYSLYDLYRAMLYVLVNGIRWRDLPATCPRGKPSITTSVAGKRWGCLNSTTRAGGKSRRRERRGQPKTVAVDSQSVPTTQKGGCAGTTVARKSKGANGT